MYIVGVDIGATNVKVGLLGEQNGQLVAKHYLPIAEERSPSVIVSLIATALDEVVKQAGINHSQISLVGVGCPGKIEDGLVVFAGNFPLWENAPLQEMLLQQLKLPVCLCNDADAAVAAEKWVGAAKDQTENFVMLTLGSGVGFGAVVDGKILRGGTGVIEGGHMILQRDGRKCPCSQNGCLEAYASANAVAQQATERVQKGESSSLSQAEVITAKLVFEAAKNGDALALELVSEAADWLGFACVNFSRILDCQIIVLSGGMAEAGSLLIEKVRDAYMKYTWTKLPNPVSIVSSSVGYDSGIIGAGAAAKFKLN